MAKQNLDEDTDTQCYIGHRSVRSLFQFCMNSALGLEYSSDNIQMFGYSSQDTSSQWRMWSKISLL